jgi:YD repeat-containing protein
MPNLRSEENEINSSETTINGLSNRVRNSVGSNFRFYTPIYDSMGRVILRAVGNNSEQDRAGTDENITTYNYDGNINVIQNDNPNNTIDRCYYDVSGNLIRIDTQNVTTGTNNFRLFSSRNTNGINNSETVANSVFLGNDSRDNPHTQVTHYPTISNNIYDTLDIDYVNDDQPLQGSISGLRHTSRDNGPRG